MFDIVGNEDRVNKKQLVFYIKNQPSFNLAIEMMLIFLSE